MSSRPLRLAGPLAVIAAAAIVVTGALALGGRTPSVTPTSTPTPVASAPAGSAPVASTPARPGTPSPTPAAPVRPVTAPLPAGMVTMLLLGTDNRGEETGRSDVLILVQFTPDRKRVNVVSIPRDTYAAIPGHGSGKINAAFAYGGPELARQAVSQLLGGLPIQYTVQTDFAGFYAMVRDLGTVTVNNKYASTVSGVRFAKGPITLNAEHALMYVRQRKGLPMGDLDRTERHRAVLVGMVKRLREIATTDPVRAIRVVASGFGHVKLTGGLTLPQAYDMVEVLMNVGQAGLRTTMMPISRFATIDGASVDLVDATGLARLNAALRTGDLSAVAGR